MNIVKLNLIGNKTLITFNCMVLFRYAKGLQTRKSPTALEWLTAVHLLNVRTCMQRGGEIDDFVTKHFKFFLNYIEQTI